MVILQCLESVFGLRINLGKTRLYEIGVDVEEVNSLAYVIGCALAVMPFLYLGMLVGLNMSRIKSWDPVIKKMEDRLSSWKTNNLSIDSRLTLIKSVLGTLPLYFLLVFRALAMVIIKSLRLKFF